MELDINHFWLVDIFIMETKDSSLLFSYSDFISSLYFLCFISKKYLTDMMIAKIPKIPIPAQIKIISKIYSSEVSELLVTGG